MSPDPSDPAASGDGSVPSGLSRRDLFRLGAGVAAVAAGAAAVTRGGTAFAAAESLQAVAAGPGGSVAKVLESGFRVYLDGHEMPNVRAVEFGALETNLELLQSVASEVIYRDVVARLPIVLRAAVGEAPELEAWFDATRSSGAQPTRTIRVELLAKKGSVLARTIVASECVLESFTPGPLTNPGRTPPEDVYAAACPVTHGRLAVESA